jgi:transposase
VHTLQAHGLSQAGISAQLAMSRKTVRRFQRSDRFPERARPRRRPSMLDAHDPYLRDRWTAGGQNAHTLSAELRPRGFTGAPAVVRRYVASWRTAAARQGRAAQRAPAPAAAATPPAPPLTRVLSPRQARWLLSKPLERLEPTEQCHRQALVQGAPVIAAALERIDACCELVRRRDPVAYQRWLLETEQCDLPELRSLVAGIRRDQAAVDAALTSPWSNGQTEGQIKRLKTLQRQMYGRAKLDLLRQRFLAAA